MIRRTLLAHLPFFLLGGVVGGFVVLRWGFMALAYLAAVGVVAFVMFALVDIFILSRMGDR